MVGYIPKAKVSTMPVFHLKMADAVEACVYIFIPEFGMHVTLLALKEGRIFVFQAHFSNRVQNTTIYIAGSLVNTRAASALTYF